MSSWLKAIDLSRVSLSARISLNTSLSESDSLAIDLAPNNFFLANTITPVQNCEEKVPAKKKLQVPFLRSFAQE
eukprot:Pgem_evm2s5878